MLAPRKTLWSTPLSALDAITQDWIPNLQCNDVVVDIGCGDGTLLLHWAKLHTTTTTTTTKTTPKSSTTATATACSTQLTRAQFIGIDIDETRIQQAQQQAIEMGLSDTCVFHCANALTNQDLFEHGTIFFLYLIPRGLRLLQPLLPLSSTKSIQVITYMAPLPDTEFVVSKQRVNISVPHQPGAAWPLYYYQLKKNDNQQHQEQGNAAIIIQQPLEQEDGH